MKMRWMLVVAACLAGCPVTAQILPAPPAPAMPRNLPMHSALFDAQQLAAAKDWTTADLKVALAARGLRLTDDREIHVTIEGPVGEAAVPAALVTAVGGRDDTSWGRFRDAWIPVGRLVELAESLPPGHVLGRVATPLPSDVMGEGPATVHSDTYRDAGADGTGRVIGVIDMGFEGLAAAWANGDIPGLYYWHNYTPDPLESGGVHGTGCVEAAYDHCPGAVFHIFMIDSPTDLGNVVQDARDLGVNVLSCSLAWGAGGWADDVGPATEAFNVAAGNGILVVVSAGNYALCHYQGMLYVGGDDWHNFGPDDETVNIVVEAGTSVVFNLQWNLHDGPYDLDLYLFDAAQNQIASSTSGDNIYEFFTYANPTAVDQLVHLAVLGYSGGATEFEIFTHYGTWQEHQVAMSSTAPPTNSSNPNVISVGAAAWDDFSAPPGDGTVIAGYSGRGPTNSGGPAPLICGPTNCASFTYPDGMGGTSNAAPNVAGAICAFWSADPLLDPIAVRWLVLKQAEYARDWGTAGLDYTYGFGGAFLADHHAGTIWVARDFLNLANLRPFPAYTAQAAHDWMPDGGRLLFLGGGHYPEPVVLDKNAAIEHPGGPLVLGE